MEEQVLRTARRFVLRLATGRTITVARSISLPACVALLASLALLCGCGQAHRQPDEGAERTPARAAAFQGNDDAPAGARPASRPRGRAVRQTHPPTSLSLRNKLQRALGSAIARAAAFGGQASLALWLDGWGGPLVARGAAPAYGRMWSMSKPVAIIATYEAAQRRGDAFGSALVTAATDAITRSDNCAERRIILGLQQLTGGLTPALSAFDGVLARAGYDDTTTPEKATLEQPSCLAYFAQRAPTATPEALAWEFGTDEWTVAQAASFAHALATGAYGASGRFALTLMALPKRHSLSNIEGPSGDHIANLQWGAGTAFAPWHPAYKPGWGGSQQGHFLGGQIAVLEDASPPLAIAAMFYPNSEPATDDIGATEVPEALEAVFDTVREALVSAGVLRWPPRHTNLSPQP